jgi:hypothetical protein
MIPGDEKSGESRPLGRSTLSAFSLSLFAQLEALDLLLDRRLLAEEEDGDQGRLGLRPQRADELGDVQVGRGHVKHDDPRQVDLRVLQGLLAVVVARDAVAAAGEGACDGGAGGFVGGDQQDLDVRHGEKVTHGGGRVNRRARFRPGRSVL